MDLEKVNKIRDVRKKLLEPEIQFLKNLQKYLEMPVYIYGSLFRLDYFPNKSDIDIAIFADNLESTVNRLIDFLGISPTKVKIFKVKSTNKKTDKTKIIPCLKNI
jgi:predicted nucleotidyltransferase